MKIERINDNQIRCTLSSADLSMRNLNLGELAYGTEKARNLFREMIQKASSEVGFEADDIPLMVEAIPLSSESVMFVITKIEDPEELDTRFSRFSPMAEDNQANSWDGLTKELLEGADCLVDLLKKDLLGVSISGGTPATQSSAPPTADQTKTGIATAAPMTRIFRFASLDAAADAAHVAGQICNCHNTLFKKPDVNQYFLVLSSEGCNSLAFSRLCNILSEYGEKIHQETASSAYYQEHYEVIIHDQALQKLMSL